MKKIRKDNLLSFLRQMARSGKVYAPQLTNEQDLLFLPLGEGTWNGDVGKTSLSPKAFFFPQSEEILRFVGQAVSKIMRFEKTFLFGLRACDVKALHFVDRFMARDGMSDPHYFSRRKDVTIAAVACIEPPEESCFCVDAGGAPYPETEIDLQFYDTGDHYLVDAGTGRGEEILSIGLFETVGEDGAAQLEALKKKAREAQVNKPGVKEAVGRLRDNLADAAFWERLAERCINCGTCVYVCPTCTCFNVFDLPSEGGFTRWRCWDACLHAGFTRETSGHNPRPTPGSRLARRHEHKFKFDVLTYGKSGCVGCGRCTDACPVSLGAAQIIQEVNRLPG